MSNAVHTTVETPWSRNTLTGEKVSRFVDGAEGWKVGHYCIQATPYSYDKYRDTVYDVYALKEHANGDLVIYGHDVTLYSDSQYGRVILHREGWLGPFHSIAEAKEAVAARNAREAA